MKKLFPLIIVVIIMTGVAFGILSKRATALNKIDDAQIYFFYQERCPHCHHARDYIKEKYPRLAVEYRDIAVQKNLSDFYKYAKKFNLKDEELGTPLICMGKHVILGWNDKEKTNFDTYVKPFLK